MKFLSFVSCLLFAAFSSVAASKDLALQILQEYNSDKGLCLHLGSTEDLGAELAVNSKMLVQTLVSDEASRRRTLSVLEKRGVSGQAAVEVLNGKSLMFVPDTVNLLVVEDPESLKKAGIDRTEMLRVLAPYGLLYFKEKAEYLTIRIQTHPRL